jgi:hypothetical protein
LEIDNVETCPACGSQDNRRKVIGGTGFFGEKDWDTKHFSHALGKVVKSYADEKRIAREMGMEEIGNEPVDNVHKYFEERKKKELDETYEKDQDKLEQIIRETRAS